MTDSPLQIAGRQFTSRLMVGTGKFSSNESMKEALEASGSQIVTVALRRADLTGSHDPAANILDFIDPEKYLILPNTSGATTAEEAVRLARLAALPQQQLQDARRIAGVMIFHIPASPKRTLALRTPLCGGPRLF